jgi:hypothetical protein
LGQNGLGKLWRCRWRLCHRSGMDGNSDLRTAAQSALIDIIVRQRAIIDGLEKRIAQWEGRAKSPGSGRMPGLKPKGDGKPDQPGKPRKRRPQGFARVKTAPTQRVEQVVEQCPDCGSQLSGGRTQRAREVIELPQVPAPATARRYCPCRPPVSSPPCATGVGQGFYAADHYYDGPKQRCWAHLRRDHADLASSTTMQTDWASGRKPSPNSTNRPKPSRTLSASQRRGAQLALARRLLSLCRPGRDAPAPAPARLYRRISNHIKELFSSWFLRRRRRTTTPPSAAGGTWWSAGKSAAAPAPTRVPTPR